MPGRGGSRWDVVGHIPPPPDPCRASRQSMKKCRVVHGPSTPSARPTDLAITLPIPPKGQPLAPQHPIGNDGPCSCCSAPAAARVDTHTQAAQRPSNKITRLVVAGLCELPLSHAGEAALDMSTLQATRRRPPLLYQPSKHNIKWALHLSTGPQGPPSQKPTTAVAAARRELPSTRRPTAPPTPVPSRTNPRAPLTD